MNGFRYSIFLLLLTSPILAQQEPVALSPQETVRHMKLPEGFRATVFAAEPDIAQPIAFTFDERGRMWVVECYSYPDWGQGVQDRVSILEDTDGDGRFDSKKVFWDEGTNLSGIALGFGGVWLCATPNLIFVPDEDRDDVADGPAVVKLDGWDLEGQHNVFNALTWGPDGWLYGCNGILSKSLVGKPGTAAEDRTPINCGVWRYHPQRETFEAFAHGTTNPWGLDFDEVGEMFITNCVIAHLWHVVPGARYDRMFGQDFNPHAYSLMKTCADHLHWAGGHWTESRGGVPEHSDAGGGHAHVGAMIYQGDNWPEEYRGRLFTCNLHGTRVNQDILARNGSGYVARHGKDLLHVNDPWFRGLAVQYGPDGGVYLTDWSDTGECHDYDDVKRESGRIYKITYGPTKRFQGDLWSASNEELVKLLSHRNEWFVRQARHVLHQRAATGADMTKVHADLKKVLHQSPEPAENLRALWALKVTGGADDELLASLLRNKNEHLRNWAIRLLCDLEEPASKHVEQFVEMAKSDESPKVRLALASALGRMRDEDRLKLARVLAQHAGDAADPNIPLMVWYGAEPALAAAPDQALRFLIDAKIPLVREFLARRLTTLLTAGLSTGAAKPGRETTADSALDLTALVDVLRSAEPTVQQDIVRGMYAALEGRKDVAMPGNWPAAYEELSSSDSKTLRAGANRVALIFRDPAAVEKIASTVQDVNVDVDERVEALQSLLHAQAEGLSQLLVSLLKDKVMRSSALQGLAALDDRETPQRILEIYGSLTTQEKDAAIGTLASRKEYAFALLGALESKNIDAADLSAFSVRQLLALGDEEITRRLNDIWGPVRLPDQDKAAAIASYKQVLRPETLEVADKARGRAVFARTCAACHKLFDDGGTIGPDLTGSQRNNLDYVLENLLDPSAVVGADYRMTLIQTDSGRVITGIVKEETPQTVVIQTPTERIIVPTDEIEARQQSPLSMMPEGMISQLSEADLRALVAYLASPNQVELAAEHTAP